MQDYILGIDIGTGSTKAVAITMKGIPLFDTQSFYPESATPTIQDPETIWDAFMACIKQTTDTLQKQPLAVALSSAMHSVMAVDSGGVPLSPLITWADSRAANIAEDLATQPLGRVLYEACGTPIHPLSPLCKIAWWRLNEPQLFSEVYKFIGIKEWIWYRLFHVYEVDYSIASAMGMFDVNRKQWHPKALVFAGIDENSLSLPVPTTFSRAYQNEGLLPFSESVSFVIGASDGCLANLGTSALNNGTAAVTIGTSGAVRVAADKALVDFEKQTFHYILDDGIWINGGPVNNGGAAVQWAAQNLFGESLHDGLLSSIIKIAAGSDGLLFLPYLLGERAPIWDSRSSASFIGLRQHHTKQHMLKAAIEGVCFALRSVMEPLEAAAGRIDVLHVSGGFTRSEGALQILADVTGKKLELLQTADASAIGAGYLALKALRKIEFYEQLPQPTIVAAFYPNEEAHSIYTNMFSIYQSLYPVLKDAMHHLRTQ